MLKRIADWLEKMSAAFMVGSVLTNSSAFAALGFGLMCLGFSLYLTKKGRKHD
ncbi:MAG: hypothetical protein LBM00_05630 [Deltaproteobacteria bacterium]|jgi:LPXTG-motif cell wall-anchored protein|nr:hypothetical protein [Deltaproteobacteria bacterium]